MTQVLAETVFGVESGDLTGLHVRTKSPVTHSLTDQLHFALVSAPSAPSAFRGRLAYTALFRNTNKGFSPCWAIVNPDGEGQE